MNKHGSTFLKVEGDDKKYDKMNTETFDNTKISKTAKIDKILNGTKEVCGATLVTYSSEYDIVPTATFVELMKKCPAFYIDYLPEDMSYDDLVDMIVHVVPSSGVMKDYGTCAAKPRIAIDVFVKACEKYPALYGQLVNISVDKSQYRSRADYCAIIYDHEFAYELYGENINGTTLNSPEEFRALLPDIISRIKTIGGVTRILSDMSKHMSKDDGDRFVDVFKSVCKFVKFGEQ